MGNLPRLLGVFVVAILQPIEMAPSEAVNNTDLAVTTQLHGSLSYIGVGSKTNQRILTRPDLFLIQFGYAADWNETYLEERMKNGQPIGLKGKELTEALKAYQRQNDLPVTGLLDAITQQAMLRPRCGVSDVQRGRFTIFPNKWEKDVLTYNIVKYSKHLPKPMVELALKRAFGYWEKVSSLKFARKPDGEPADFRIGFFAGEHGDGQRHSFDGPSGIFGRSQYPNGGNIHFDDEEEFTEDTSKGKNFRIIAAHEIGHALGLDHSWMKGSLMYPVYQGYVPHNRLKLTVDDVAGIRHMYGPGDNVDDPLDMSDLESMMMADEYPTNDEEAPTTIFTTTTTTQMMTTTTPTPVTKPMWAKPTAGPGQPDPCNSNVDAAFQWHDAAKYFLRGTLLYRQDPGETSMMSVDFPRDVRRYLIDAPVKTDAAVYSPFTSNLYLFRGKSMYVYDSHGYLRKKEIMDHPEFPANIDAAFINRDGTVCLIKDDLLYEFDEYRNIIENIFPLSSVYGGLPKGIDAVINDSPYVLDYQFIYFFKGSEYYKVDMRSRSVMRHYPREMSGPWFGCSTWTVPK